MIRKKLKRWGNNLVAVFTKEDEEVYELVEGDIINLDDMIKEGKDETEQNGEIHN